MIHKVNHINGTESLSHRRPAQAGAAVFFSGYEKRIALRNRQFVQKGLKIIFAIVIMEA
ncbi:MAG: hypothetical protein LUD83_07270 [Clostridiales bacterium]|nr:hypothetical protein [Clostridiales bacterium]